jgi:superfamily II DNA or RNA helicase
MIPPSPEDVDEDVLEASAFSASALAKAVAYQRQGRVSILDDAVFGGERVLKTRVRGTAPGAYVQSIRIARSGVGSVDISGTCTCPMEFNCKHVAAAVLHWQEVAPATPVARPAAQTPTEAIAPALSAPLAGWLAGLDATVRRMQEADGPVRRRLVYILSRLADGAAGVDLMSRELDKLGQPKGEPKAYDTNNALSSNPAKFLRVSDLAILRRLPRAGWGGSPDARYRLHGRDGATLLLEILETGRAFWRKVDGVALLSGPPRDGSGLWRIGDDGAQRFGFAVADVPDALSLALSPPYYVDPKSGEVGTLRTGLADAVVERLLGAPPIPPEEAAAVGEAFARVLPPDTAPAPKAVLPVVEVRAKPTPIARLTLRDEPRWTYGYHSRSSSRWQTDDPPRRLPALEVAFDYDGVRFAPNATDNTVSNFDGVRVRRTHRSPATERKHVKRLSSLGLTPFPTDWSYGRQYQTGPAFWLGESAVAQDYARFLLDGKPALEAEGWRVEIDPDFPVRLAEAQDELLSLAIADPVADDGPEGSGIDWFDLSLGVTIDGERLDLLPVFVSLLAGLPAGKEQEALARLAEAKNPAGGAGRLLVTLPDGRILPLALARVASIVEALLAVWGPSELKTGVRLHVAQAADLADLEARLAGHVSVIGGGRLRLLAEELSAFRDRPPSALPSWFAGSLRPYQQVGLDWLQMLARAGFGGVLADDMGLGKTVQMLAHLAIEKEAGRLDTPALVVAPTSVLGNWRAEAERFAPKLATVVHQGLKREKERLDTAGIDLVVTSYPVLARDRELLLGRRWSVAVLDEAQTIRNPAATTSLATFALDARQRLALSGTPVENHLGDIWSLMRFLNPGLLGDAKSFRTLYRTPIEKNEDAGARARLSRRLKPFLLRRTKAEVAADLPEKTEIRESVTLTPAQRQLYEATRLVMQKKVRDALEQRGLARSAIVVLDALLKLRQACCDPRLVKSATEKAKAGGSAKLDRLVELVEELKEESRSVLVFSQFTSMLQLIRTEFDARGWRYAWLTGDTTDRATPIAAFQGGGVDLFLISLKAGGLGLNLTRADTVILYDPWWNPAVEAQAIDRAHRIGQTRPVFVHRLIAEDSIEEKMLELQARKKGFADALWEGEAGGFAGLTAEDVRDLFE